MKRWELKGELVKVVMKIYNTYKFTFKLLVILVVGAIGLVALTSFNSDVARSQVTNEEFNKFVATDAAGKYAIDQDVAATELRMFGIPQEKDLVIEMHKMANNYILAGEIRGRQKMTQERINTLIVGLLSVESTESVYTHKDYLLEILTNWKAGKFLQLASDHNYLWDCLSGTVGKATGVKSLKDLPAWTIGK